MAQYATALNSPGLPLLTPRTPFSRAGRAESGSATLDVADEADELDIAYDSIQGQQRAPLLSSSADDSFPHRRDKDERKRGGGSRKLNWTQICQRTPLVGGVITAIILLFLLLTSVDTPEKLHQYLHHSSNTPFGTQNVSHPVLSYENYTSFPLTPLEYRNECALFQASMKGWMKPYWWTPEGGPLDVIHFPRPKVCSSSVTYMLDGYVGLAADLALIAQVAGLAREQNRTFFIDDRNWNRGKWSDYFQDVHAVESGPEPGCLPPPPEELVACPRTAQHWVVNSRTAVFHFGHHFQEEFEDPYARELRRLKPIFQRSAQSLQSVVRPNVQIASSISAIRREVAEISPSYVAVHVRRGDRKAESWAYHGGYVPLTEYSQALMSFFDRPSQSTPPPVVYLASDDPASLTQLERILTISPSSSSNPSSDAESNRPRIFALSESKEMRGLASKAAYVQKEFNVLEEDERKRLTKGALIDLALVTGLWTSETDVQLQSDAVVCTINSNFCKLAAIGLGWDKAFGFEVGDPDKSAMVMNDEKKGWIEIDNNGAIDPVWRAFEMF